MPTNKVPPRSSRYFCTEIEAINFTADLERGTFELVRLAANHPLHETFGYTTMVKYQPKPLEESR